MNNVTDASIFLGELCSSCTVHLGSSDQFRSILIKLWKYTGNAHRHRQFPASLSPSGIEKKFRSLERSAVAVSLSNESQQE